MATYSAFFSSGLLAPRVARCTTPVLPSSPMAISTSPVDPADRQLNMIPTPLGQISSCPKAPEANTNAERPRMRRRRSSINTAASPMALIKSPTRNAGAALQRTGFMSPTRHRAASVGMSKASEDNSLFGRLRSGSIGGTTNAPKRLRRAIRAPFPIVPPPNAPLPAPPLSPTTKCGGSLLPAAAIFGPITRQPFPTNPCADNDGNVYVPRLLSTDNTSKVPVQVSQGPFVSPDTAMGEVTMEN